MAQDQEQKIRFLKSLKADLMDYRDRQIKDLPSEIQSRVHNESILGPITSSGLERVSDIIIRIMWLSLFLENPHLANSAKQNNYNNNDDHHQPTPAPPAIVKPIIQTSPKPKPTIVNNQKLDFGPYDPAKTSKE